LKKYEKYFGSKIGEITILHLSGRNLVCQCACGKTFQDQANKVVSGKRQKCKDCFYTSKIILEVCISCQNTFQKRDMVESKRVGLVCKECYQKATKVKCKNENCEKTVDVSNGNHSGLCHEHRDKLRVATTIYYACRGRAAKQNLPFDLDIEWVYDRLGFCEVTGIPLNIRKTYEKEKKKGDYSDRPINGPSVDKIVPANGYLKSNCRVVCWWYNLSKSIWSDEEILNIVKTWFKNKEVEFG